MNLGEMQRMYMKDGRLVFVPEISDSNTKENRDIRRFYGSPPGSSARTGPSKSLGFGKVARWLAISGLFAVVVVAVPAFAIRTRRKSRKPRA
jgi:hypothetical protein